MNTRHRLAAGLLGALLAGAAASQELQDTDRDGVPDLLDNCIQIANADQSDFDNDGNGNACDADVNNDAIVNAIDLATLRSNFGRRNALGDLNGDGIVNAVDLAQMRRSIGRPPGPSAVTGVPPTSDGRRVPTAGKVEIFSLTRALPDGRNALLTMDFGPFFRSDPRQPPPAAVPVFIDGDALALLREGLTPGELGRPNALGPRAGERVQLNDLGLFGDEQAGDGVFSGLGRVDAERLQEEANRFLVRARTAGANRVVAFNGREAARVTDFNIGNPFVPPGPPRTFNFTLAGIGPVTVVGIPLPNLVPLLPPTTDAERTLLIRHTGVVQDPARTFSPCNNAGALVATGNVNGPWSMKTLLGNMANPVATGVLPQVFINDWLKQWLSVANNVKHSDGVAVPGFPIPARPLLENVVKTIQPGWNPANPATLDIDRLPFRLLAIVNRIDLAESGYLGNGSPGELRFVFGLLERSAINGQCVPSQEMTVILEYKVPTTTCTGLKMLANQWINLDGLVPGTPAFNAQLQALTNQVSPAGAFPGRINDSAIGQVRTNERRLALPWELREFTLQKSPVFGKLLHETVKNTPDSSHNRTLRMSNWINGAAGAEVPRQFGGADFIGTASRYGPGIAMPDKANPPWNGLPINPTGPRFDVSLNTCSGCHLSETGTSFTMIKGNGPLGAPVALAGFLTGITVNDDEYGAPPLPGATHAFDDLFRRGQVLDQIAARSCGFFPQLPLFQAPTLLQVPRPPESLFAPRFVH